VTCQHQFDGGCAFPGGECDGLFCAEHLAAHPLDEHIRVRLVQLGWTPPRPAQATPIGYIHKDAAAFHLKDPSGWARMQATADDTFTVPVFAGRA
jgi:hypothetical protein